MAKRVHGDSDDLFKRAEAHRRMAVRRLTLSEKYFTAALRALERERLKERERAADEIASLNHDDERDRIARTRPDPDPAGVP